MNNNNNNNNIISNIPRYQSAKLKHQREQLAHDLKMAEIERIDRQKQLQRQQIIANSTLKQREIMRINYIKHEIHKDYLKKQDVLYRAEIEKNRQTLANSKAIKELEEHKYITKSVLSQKQKVKDDAIKQYIHRLANPPIIIPSISDLNTSRNMPQFMGKGMGNGPVRGLLLRNQRTYSMSNNKPTIINVYQSAYKNNRYATGFGDFLRGCYFLIQFCELNDFKYGILINHPISNYLKCFRYFYNNNVSHLLLEKLNNISPFDETNFISNIDSENSHIGYTQTDTIHSTFLHHLLLHLSTNNLTVSADANVIQSPTIIIDKIYIYTIAYPLLQQISEIQKQYMREILMPTEELRLYIDQTLVDLNLMKGLYSVIHLRCGDKYLFAADNVGVDLIDKSYGSYGLEFDVEITGLMDDIIRTIEERDVQQKMEAENKLYQNIIGNIQIILDETSGPYMLISDNIQIKYKICDLYPQIKTLFHPITHLGEGTKLEDCDLQVKNTLLDMYLLSHSSNIKSFSTYVHGSGFSKWTAETYNIPYTCTYL